MVRRTLKQNVNAPKVAFDYLSQLVLVLPVSNSFGYQICKLNKTYAYFNYYARYSYTDIASIVKKLDSTL